MPIVRSTKDIAPSERFEYWQGVTCDTYVRVGCKLLEEDLIDFDAKVEEYDLGAIKISHHYLTTPMRYTRTLNDFEMDNRTDYQFLLIASGKAVVCQDGRETLVSAGNMVLYEGSQPFSLDYLTPHESITFKISQASLHARLRSPTALTARSLAGNRGMGLLAASAMRDSTVLGDFGPSMAQRAGSAILELIAATIDVELQQTPALSARHNVLLDNIKRYMLRNLEDTELTIDKIALRHNVTPRTVNRLFAQVGTTAIRWLWHQRLIASHKALSEGRVSLVSDVAMSHGFSDFSHFSRSFKKMFGICPNTLLLRK